MSRTDDWRRKRVLKVGQPILEWLGLWQTYRVQIDFQTNLKGGGDSLRAKVRHQPPYRRMFVTFDRAFVDGANEQELGRVVMHEAIHAGVFEDATEWAERRIDATGLSKKEKQRLGAEFGDLQEHAVDLVQRWIERARLGEGGLL